MSSSDFSSFVMKPPQQPKFQEIDYSDRLKRVKRAYEQSDPGGQVGWQPNKQGDIQELRTIRYKKRFPDDVTKTIGWMYRVALPKKNMFELDGETGALDSEYQVKEALVYSITESVDNPNLEDGAVAYSSPIGWYQAPIVRYTKHDEMGNGIDPVFSKWKNIFYIEFKPETVDKILSEMYNEPKSVGVAVANEFGPDSWNDSRTVHNMDEFKFAKDIYTLMEASRHGFLVKDAGGYEDFIQAKETSKKQLKPIKQKKRIVSNGELIVEE